MPPHNQANAALPLRQALTRSVAEECGGLRAVAFHQVELHAFRVVDGKTFSLDFTEGSTLAEIVESAKVHCFHKDHLLVREVDHSGDQIPERLGGGTRTRLHLFAIKRKSAPRYVYRDYQTTRVNDLYAAPVCTIDGGALL